MSILACNLYYLIPLISVVQKHVPTLSKFTYFFVDDKSMEIIFEPVIGEVSVIDCLLNCDITCIELKAP